jgi:hypothetical protein
MIKAVTIKEIEASPILMPTHTKIHQFKEFLSQYELLLRSYKSVTFLIEKHPYRTPSLMLIIILRNDSLTPLL